MLNKAWVIISSTVRPDASGQLVRSGKFVALYTLLIDLLVIADWLAELWWGQRMLLVEKLQWGEKDSDWLKKLGGD